MRMERQNALFDKVAFKLTDLCRVQSSPFTIEDVQATDREGVSSVAKVDKLEAGWLQSDQPSALDTNDSAEAFGN